MRTLSFTGCTLLALCLAAATSCTGILGSPGDAEDSGPGGGHSPQGGIDPSAAGAMVLRPLSQREYLNTVRDLLGDESLSPSEMPEEHDAADFPFRASGLVDKLNAELFRNAAEKLAANAVPHVPELLPCDVGSAGEADCARQFVERFGQKAFRRPIAPGEIEVLNGLYEAGRSQLGLDFRGAIGLVIEAILQSPGFLYHWELGPSPAVRDGEVVQLDGYALANRLSYFLWGTMPDEELFDAAERGELSSAADVERQARRMLEDERARETVVDFVEDWLDLTSIQDQSKDTTVYPAFNQELKSAMRAELRRFVTSSLFDGKGRFQDLLMSTSSFANGPLASIYGLGDVSGDDLRPVTLDPAERSGLLTTAAFLSMTGAASGSNPVRRGKAIYTRLLCGVLPKPPPNVPSPAPASAGGTTRQRFAAHSEQQCAKNCHAFMDPLGFAFEGYDGIGQFRTTDNDQPVDASGSITLDGEPRHFTDARALIELLSQSDEVHRCFVQQWFRYALGREDSEEDRASIGETARVFAESEYNVRELIVSLVTSRTFRFRVPQKGEVLQ